MLQRGEQAMSSLFPINVICFNRPDYLELLLRSLKQQTIPISNDQLYFWVDGYLGSKDDANKRLDHTGKIVELVKDYFPKCQIFRSEINLGIARNYHRAEVHSFEILGSHSAIFIEEDLELSNIYFEELSKLEQIIGEDLEISHLSVSGETTHIKSSPDAFFQTFGHNWGYLLRAWHHFERKEFIDGYLNLFETTPYYLRHLIENTIYQYFFSKGVLIAGTSQDAIKDGLRNYYGRIAVTTLNVLSSNIGIQGEHFSEATEYHHRALTLKPENIPSQFPWNEKKRLYLDGLRKTASQTFSNIVENGPRVLELANLRKETESLRKETESLRKETESLRNSLSWRATSPLRITKKFLKRGN
jgi:glycosyltransferase involved in cell wall biosynthesis